MRCLTTVPIGLLLPLVLSAASPIDRQALVARHKLAFTRANAVEIPQVGNGEIAFGLDVTGLQGLYGNTLSQWGWHSSPLPEGKRIEQFRMHEVQVHGHTATYPVSSAGQEELYTWLRENPHRLNLGRFSFVLDGQPVSVESLSGTEQTLDLWTGVVTSRFELERTPVRVVTCCHPVLDALAVRVESALVEQGRLGVQLDFPYGDANARSGADWTRPERHTTLASCVDRGFVFSRTLDGDGYEVLWTWDTPAQIEPVSPHCYALQSGDGAASLAFVCRFAPRCGPPTNPGFEQTLEAAGKAWSDFWQSGGAIDLSGSRDPRWMELERRVVLSQYLLAVNEAGSLPPQESGLVNNSGWYGKFHLEMHWWHGAHYQLWGRRHLFERSLDWYRRTLPVARGIAERQGYRGARWPKMVGPDGRFGPSPIGPWLIWQQPHPLFYAEQEYRVAPTAETLRKWRETVVATADFMASYAHRNSETGRFDLGPWLINAAENNMGTMASTRNPAFELAYWRYGLSVACRWCERLGTAVPGHWQDVLENLAPLPLEDGVYVMYEGVPNMWERFACSHIDVIGPGAFLPAAGVDMDVLRRTLDRVWTEWDLDSTWGWDFPWLAMACARAGRPAAAVEALLMDVGKNGYSVCGINRGGPATVYFPGNGGLLYAVAMMAAGWDDGSDRHAPGFPDDGSWVVRHEGLMPAQ